MIHFKDFTEALEKICKGDFTQKITLLYEMHLPPALTVEELHEISTYDMDAYDVVESAGGCMIVGWNCSDRCTEPKFSVFHNFRKVKGLFIQFGFRNAKNLPGGKGWFELSESMSLSYLLLRYLQTHQRQNNNAWTRNLYPLNRNLLRSTQ